MRVALLTYGTRGDVQPFLALARGLARAGHAAVLAAPARLAPLAAAWGVPFVPLPGDPAELVRELVAAARRGPLAAVRAARGFALPLAAGVIAGARAACEGADVVVHTLLLTTGGHALARELDAPDVSAQFFPVFAPTGAFPSPAFPPLPLGRAYNRLTHELFTQLFWHGGHLGYRRISRSHPAFPRELAWPFRASPRGPTPQLFAYSPAVVSRPPEWGPSVHVTGFWVDDADVEGYEPPTELARFLAEGEPPVCVSLGSVVGPELASVRAATLDGIRRAGRRALLIADGERGAVGLPPGALAVGPMPHGWLLPRALAVVHHGGAGTTAAALRAGVPSVVVPFSADQPFWGRRVALLGAGPPPIPARRADPARMEAAVRAAAGDPAVRRRAEELGRVLRAEDGVGRAVELIERHAREFRRAR